MIPPAGDSTPAGRTSAVRTFLIADIRGYTRFTQERGDEAAARLAARFAEIVQEGVEASAGELVELRGDEALAVFASARRAIRAAVELQEVLDSEFDRGPSAPLGVGIGLDAGEAVPVADGYRGGALNLAARLCARAGAGEVLASQGVIHLARTMQGRSMLRGWARWPRCTFGRCGVPCRSRRCWSRPRVSRCWCTAG